MASTVHKVKDTFRAPDEKRAAHLLLATPPEGQPFISGDWYMGAAWGCCSMFWDGPILDDIIGLGGLDTLLYAGSGCWPIPYKMKDR